MSEFGQFETFADGSGAIIGALIEVHRRLGPGLLESAYEACVCREFELRGIPLEKQVPIALDYKGKLVECGYRIDLVVDGWLLVELKAVEQLLPVHFAQVLTYLKLSKLHTGLLVNFNARTLKEGLRRISATPQEQS